MLLSSLLLHAAPAAAPAATRPEGLVKVRQAIRAAGLSQPLVPTGEGSLEHAGKLGAIVSEVWGAARSGPEPTAEMVRQQAAELEQFAADNPGSPFAPSIHVELGDYFRAQGLMTKALDHWEAGWLLTAQLADPVAVRLADRALVQQAQLLASLGRLEELEALLAAGQGRRFQRAHHANLWARTREACAHMRRRPEIAYKCGVFALNNVARALTGKASLAIALQPSEITGFSLAQLQELAEAGGLNLVAAYRRPGAELVVPSVVHWAQDHYAALVSETEHGYVVQDPTFGDPWLMNAGDLEAEASGYFLIPADRLPAAGWRLVDAAEAAGVFGKGYPWFMNDDEPPPCECCDPEPPDGGSGPSGTGSETNECGMATWRVQEPHVNLTVTDIPLKYDAPYGPDFVLDLGWRQRGTKKQASDRYSHFGDGWHCGLVAWAGDNYAAKYGGLGAHVFYLMAGDGFRYTLNFGSSQQYSDVEYSHGLVAKRNLSGSTVTSLEIFYSNGAHEIYESIEGSHNFRLATRKDATKQAIEFTYEDPGGGSTKTRLKQVTLAGGAVFSFVYDNLATDPYDQHRILGVTGPDSRSVSFGYAGTGEDAVLQSITDVVGLVSAFTYDANGWVGSLVTPYGTNSFTHFDQGIGAYQQYNLAAAGIDRHLLVDEPEAARQVYLFYDNWNEPGTNGLSGRIPNAFSSHQLPVYATTNEPPVQTLSTSRFQRNSHYWNRQQAAALSTANPTNFTAADFRLSRTTHWIAGWDPERTLNTRGWVLPPSADGVNEGQPIFYDYVGKDLFDYGTEHVGTNSQPAVIAQRRLDGATWTTWYKHIQRNSRGMGTNTVERWVAGGVTQQRTNTFKYVTGTGDLTRDDVLLLEHRGPGGGLVVGYALHPTYTDQYQYETNAVGEVTAYNYDAYRRLTTRQTHAGLLSTYTYGGDGRLEKIVDSAGGTAVRTNSYTWLKGFPRTHTSPRGLTLVFDYDLLGRLTKTTYPDSTTEEHFYGLAAGNGFNTSGSPLALLDRVSTKDRRGHYWFTLPNRLRQIEAIIEPPRVSGGAAVETLLSYCGCGSPTEIVRAAGVTGVEQTTTYLYDYRGNATHAYLPDGTGITNTYDVFGRLAVRHDAYTKTTNTWDALHRLLTVRNGAGQVAAYGYDHDDRRRQQTDANGVLVTNLFDGLGRLLVRGYPDGGKEQWGYTPGYGEPTSYTNQVGDITTWAYDSSQRQTSEVQVGLWTNSFTYAPAGDLLALLDGRGKRTEWNYDAEGQVTNKLHQHATTTAMVEALRYTYQPGGLLNTRWSAAKGTTTYKFDAVGNLTNVVYSLSGTPAITNRYDALNRLTNMLDGTGLTKFTYALGGGKEIITEDGPYSYDLLTVTNRQGRRLGLGLQQISNSWTTAHTYDAGGRLGTVVSPAGTFTYAYTNAPGVSGAAGRLVARLALPNTSYITNRYDSVTRLLSTVLNTSGHAALNSHSYEVNAAAQRTRHTRTDGAHVNYAYDAAGQLTVAWTTNNGGVRIDAECWGYLYDAGQNLNKRTNNASGSTSTFTVDNRNQLTSGYTYDANGNLTYKGSDQLTYDAENQLVDYTIPGSYKTAFAYDGRGRLRQRTEYYSAGGTNWTFASQVTYLYDGRRVIQERNGTTPVVAYTRGHDLAGSLEGAGGIGGLLARTHGYSAGNWSTHHYYHADGNGNITYLVNSSQGLGCSYRYRPFGETLSQTSGTLSAGANAYRFSSKEWMGVSGLYYYGYRFYQPTLQRWINRDPLGEAGGINLYGFVNNSPVMLVDPFGEAPEAVHCALDVIGALEPTPIADLTNAALYASDEDYGNAAISALGAVPYLGDLAKIGKYTNKALKSGRGAGGGGPPNKPSKPPRTEPANLPEKLALDEAKGGACEPIMKGKIADPNYPADKWDKMQHVHEHPDGTKTVIHYWKDNNGNCEGFKFK